MSIAQLPPGPTEAKFKQALKMGMGIFDYLEECHKKFGDAFTLNLSGMDPMVWVSDKEMVKDFFNLKPDQIDQSSLPIPIDAGDDAVGFVNGKYHADTRKVMVPPFVGKELTNRAETMHEIITRHINKMLVGDQYDMPRLIGDITLDIITYTLLHEKDGERFNRYHHLMLDWIQASTNDSMFLIGTLYGPSKFRNMLHKKYRERGVNGKTGSPIDRVMPWNKSINLKVELAAMIRNDIRQIRANPDTDYSGVLAGFALSRWDSGELIDEEKVISEVIAVLTGGHETSAATGGWYMLWLMKKPHIYKRMREEVLLSIEDKGHFDPLAICENKYLNACLNEAQRLTPSAVGTMRHLVGDTKIGSLTLPGSTNVLASAYLRQRDKRVWGDDALEFRPERWLAEGFRPGPFDFFPFGGGRRACIGANQAKQQLRILFAEFARRVEFDSIYSENNKWPGQQQVSGQTEPKGGVPVTITKVRPFDFCANKNMEQLEAS
ncbi:MAG: cytochrome P450 [Pseudomonadales bacterium]|nr:cytochrome P450 [Pseudomonadales bacterium]